MNRLYLLAFDHRSSFSRDLLGITGEPTAEEATRVADAKLVVYEGFERREDCLLAAERARAGGRDDVSCIVLGRGADESRVLHWLGEAARLPGFTGFPFGRTLWWNELVACVGGEIGRVDTAQRIAANYRRMIAAYERAGAG